MKRRLFLALSIATASGLTAGCKGIGPITDRWLEDSKYEETLSAFLITQDGKKLVVLGKKYHYIFDMPPQLRAVMTASYRQKLNTEFIDFEAQGDKISGRYRIDLSREDAQPDSDARARALADGFKDEGYRLTERGTISGMRYLPSSLDGAELPQAFNSEYHVDVTEKPTAVGAAVKLALSPVAVAADGGLAVMQLALFPIGFPILMIAMQRSSSSGGSMHPAKTERTGDSR
ncbi:5-formyltetrahydrofolate cyclo-ligase [Burkholderia ubonensis]|uniref:5-formyltetrahydrofolate cyclo-ligase n=1 Tax=Burkholderia ubonensis subsp. mesacidophila TaxID=265293 RepID=A0A2A4EMD9_9BURK|nr:5-formyltetrahydrofolate cyclo-ligase [Burkholderia ubonensis]PCE21540.1 5-formyltetrahydrofolate cyclo-ligase [Burkholderia ubonensis subsp. mesacidophila]